MPSASDRASRPPREPGWLEAIGPHWTSELSVYNHRFERVAHAIGRLAPVKLPPGLYDVEATLGGVSDHHMVKLEPGRRHSLSQSDWEGLTFPSAIPLEGTSTTRLPHTREADRWSRQNTWDAPLPSSSSPLSRLFIFVRTLEPGAAKRFAEDLELLDRDGRHLTWLTDDTARFDRHAGCMAFTTLLPPGPYLFRRRGYYRREMRCQPLFLCAGWETQLFIPSVRYPVIEKASLIYAEQGSGFSPRSEENRIAEMVLEGLRRGQNVASSEQMQQLLTGKFHWPWLGVLAAHALRLDEGSRNAELYATVVGNLHRLLGDHPDVQALRLPLLERGEAPPPLPFPPLLRASLELVNQHAVSRHETIPPDSLTDCILRELYPQSAWTSWGRLHRVPRPLSNFLPRGRALSGWGRPRIAHYAPEEPMERHRALETLADLSMHHAHLLPLQPREEASSLAPEERLALTKALQELPPRAWVATPVLFINPRQQDLRTLAPARQLLLARNEVPTAEDGDGYGLLDKELDALLWRMNAVLQQMDEVTSSNGTKVREARAYVEPALRHLALGADLIALTPATSHQLLYANPAYASMLRAMKPSHRSLPEEWRALRPGHRDLIRTWPKEHGQHDVHAYWVSRTDVVDQERQELRARLYHAEPKWHQHPSLERLSKMQARVTALTTCLALLSRMSARTETYRWELLRCAQELAELSLR